MGLVENLKSILGGGGCEKLVKYQAQATALRGGEVLYAGVKFSVASFERWVSKLVDADALAMALDDFQYLICRISREIPKKDPDRKLYRDIRVAAASLITELRYLLEAFKRDPESKKEGLDNSIRAMREFNESVVKRVWTDGLKGAEPAFPSSLEEPKTPQPIIIPPPEHDVGYARGGSRAESTSRRSPSKAKKKEPKGRRVQRKGLFDSAGVRRRTSPKPSSHLKRVLPNLTVISPSQKVATDALRIAGLSSDDVESLSKEIEV